MRRPLRIMEEGRQLKEKDYYKCRHQQIGCCGAWKDNFLNHMSITYQIGLQYTGILLIQAYEKQMLNNISNSSHLLNFGIFKRIFKKVKITYKEICNANGIISIWQWPVVDVVGLSCGFIFRYLWSADELLTIRMARFTSWCMLKGSTTTPACR
jgi:hypothetical protein